MCLLAICVSSWRNVCLVLLPIFQLGCLYFCCWAICVFWKLNPCQSHLLQILSPFYRFFFLLCLWFSWRYKSQCVWLGPIYLSLFLFLLPWETDLRKNRWELCHKILPVISSRSLTVSCLILKSLSHFEFIFVYGVRVCSNFIDLYATVHLFRHILLNRLCFLDCIFLHSCQRLIDHKYVGLFWVLYSVTLIHMSAFVPTLCCYDYYSFLVLSEVWGRLCLQLCSFS